jgi:tripartite-type tricarboxylate transporter receptor subunit TctC
VVNPALPVRSVKEFLDYAKKNPGVTYGSAGAGTSMHMAGALFQVMSGAAMTHVPYKGTSEAVLAVARGDVQAMFTNLPPALPMIKDGRVRAIAYTTPARLDGLPELPNIGEAGLAGYDVSVWFGLFAPAGTPAPVVTRLAREFRAALGDAAVRDKLVAQGYLLRSMDAAEFGNFVKGENAKWGKVVRETGAKVE